MKQLSVPTRLFLIFTYALGTSVFVHNILKLKVSESILLGILFVLGAILHILKVEGATKRSHYTLSFLVFGFAMVHLGMPEAILVILVSNLAEWIWNRPPWFIQLFNISCYVIGVAVAGAMLTIINPAGTTANWQAIAAIVLAMGGFTIINHLFVGIIVWMARRENFKQSGIFSLIPLIIDLTMMSLGASMAIVWDYNAYALLIFLIPAYPLYMALKIPALERKSEIDMKTGLFNHHYFMTQFNNELVRSHRYDRPLSIIIGDLDLLRNINNTYGHLAGDEVLKGVADILKQTVREYDLVARFGGEEFAILMPEADIEAAIERAEYIRKAIESARFVVATSVEPIKATMSFGISKRENFEQSVEEIIHNADTALYRSKLDGRNTSLAYLNHNYLKADSSNFEPPPSTEAIPFSQRLPDAERSTENYSAASTTYHRPAPSSPDKTSQPAPSEARTAKFLVAKQTQKPVISVMRYIILLTITSLVFLATTLTFLSEAISGYLVMNWLGFASIAIAIGLTEWFSINLYVKNTSLSTSAVPILALIILFGPLGTLAASLVFATIAAIKYRSQAHRIIFNFSNHILAGTVINMLTHVTGAETLGWEYPLFELAIALAASLLLFIVTTSLISIGVGLDIEKSPYDIWSQQYQWMAPYYLGIGFIAFALMFGYEYADLLGILTMLIPMALLRISQAQYVEHTRLVVNELRQKNTELETRSAEISELNEGLLETLSEIIDLRDPYVLGHSKMVSKYASDIARLMKLSERQIELIRKAGLLHDIGKLGVALEILAKPSNLTPEEYDIVKQHAAVGAELVRKSPALREIAPMIRHHHEYYDGNGYPDELKGNQIGIEARILSVADAIEAMTSDRPYRKALGCNRVIKELHDYSGTQFDPIVVEAAIRMLGALTAEKAAAPDLESARQLNVVNQLAINPQIG